MRNQLKHFAIVAVLLAAACALSSKAFAQETTTSTYEARQSIVYIWFDVTNPTTGAKLTVQGTGIIVSKSGYVLTASHLFRDWGKQTDPDRKQNLIRGSLRDKPGLVFESPLILQVINPGNADYEDVALLKLPDAVPSFSVAPVCLQEASAAKVGDNFVGYGFPLDQPFQPVQGTLGTSNALRGGWAASAPFTYGMSGGPVYTIRGFVVGLIRGGVPGTPAVNWITPIQHAIDLLQKAGYVEDCAWPRPEPAPNGPSGDGLTFQKIVWRNHYLDANGDFRGEVQYSVKNLSNINIVKLPNHEASWRGWHIPPPTVRTEIYGEERNAYSIEKRHFSGSEYKRSDIDGKLREVTNYLWQGDINPALPPKKSLNYAVIIATKGTEQNAFTSDGSFAGMWSPVSVHEMSCELYAPEGYRFKNPLAYFVKDRSGIMKDSTGVSKPEFMSNDTKVIWSVKKPSPNLLYMIKVVIVKAN